MYMDVFLCFIQSNRILLTEVSFSCSFCAVRTFVVKEDSYAVVHKKYLTLPSTEHKYEST